jgi:ubiquinone/menaquinone biosynthesis C-methylase UbiE
MSYQESYSDQLRVNFLKYTREAFRSLPRMENPNVLEVGCGSGTVTIELAKLTNGSITAIDVNQALLDHLSQKLKEENLSYRVTIKKMDLLKNNFPNNHFDLIWEEGVVQIIGIEKSLVTCHRILKERKFLVLGQAIQATNKDLISKCGFKMVNQINWPEGCWWTEYYEPLEQKIKEIGRGKEDPNIFRNVTTIKAEIEQVKSNLRATDCAHFILQKI